MMRSELALTWSLSIPLGTFGVTSWAVARTNKLPEPEVLGACLSLTENLTDPFWRGPKAVKAGITVEFQVMVPDDESKNPPPTLMVERSYMLPSRRTVRVRPVRVKVELFL